MQFANYSPAALKQAPNIQMIGDYKVEFVAYESEGNMDKSPVMFLGGALHPLPSQLRTQSLSVWSASSPKWRLIGAPLLQLSL